MPFKIWDLKDGSLVSAVIADWERVLTAEEYRKEAEELDGRLDQVLDTASAWARKDETQGRSSDFNRAWTVGHAIATSGILNHPSVRKERRQLLWKALARKCRLGARQNGQIDADWSALRPTAAGEPRREGGRLDYFEMCLWLADQSREQAGELFGESVRNAWQMLERPTLRSLSVRTALLGQLRLLPSDPNNRLTRAEFADLMKKLRAKWPDRGPGSARRPEHLSLAVLSSEIRSVIGSLLLEPGNLQTP